MEPNEIRSVIESEFSNKENLVGIGEDENFFEAGVSSLTIIELQILVEERLSINVPTGDLMRLSTMRGWIEAYTENAKVGVTN